MISDECTEACEAMPECATCHKRKHPRGRDPGIYTANSYCEHECPGHNEPPHAGHLWPGELAEYRAESKE